MNVDNQVTIIEITADYLCLVVIGDKVTIDELITDMKEFGSSENVNYVPVKIDVPIANKCFEMSKELGKDIVPEDGAESAQCYTYAEGYHDQSYMLMCIQDDTNISRLGYPKFDLGDEEYPEIIIENWFKKRVKKLPSGIKKNLKPVTVVGAKSNILVVSTKIKNKKKKQKKDDDGII